MVREDVPEPIVEYKDPVTVAIERMGDKIIKNIEKSAKINNVTLDNSTRPIQLYSVTPIDAMGNIEIRFSEKVRTLENLTAILNVTQQVN